MMRAMFCQQHVCHADNARERLKVATNDYDCLFADTCFWKISIYNAIVYGYDKLSVPYKISHDCFIDWVIYSRQENKGIIEDGNV